ncbi:hypothetical protein C0J52_08262 [Blattella germanica]|nr:hypothetical protein C0J52_08262 [Blattella germanica]
MSTGGMRLQSFTCSEKLKIIKDTEEHGNRASARKFDKESCISFLKCKKFSTNIYFFHFSTSKTEGARLIRGRGVFEKIRYNKFILQ